MKVNKITLSLISICLFGSIFSSYPIAVFHGLGDLCLNPGMGQFTKHLGEQTDSISHCFESGGSLLDFVTSFNTQAEKACNHLKANKDFYGKEISVVGLSQGSLIARYIIEECDFGGKVKRYVSIGGPQMGVAAFPHCESGIACNIINSITDSLVYTTAIQNHVGPAGYFHDYKREDAFRKGSTFLASLNNEVENDKAETYKFNISSLEKMVLIKFSQDTMIIPRETVWFQFYDSEKNLLPFEKTDVYENDLLGLKTLHQSGNIEFFEIEGDHLQFSTGDVDRLMVPYLK